MLSVTFLVYLFGGTFRNAIKTQQHPQLVEDAQAKFSIIQKWKISRAVSSITLICPSLSQLL